MQTIFLFLIITDSVGLYAALLLGIGYISREATNPNQAKNLQGLSLEAKPIEKAKPAPAPLSLAEDNAEIDFNWILLVKKTYTLLQAIKGETPFLPSLHFAWECLKDINQKKHDPQFLSEKVWHSPEALITSMKAMGFSGSHPFVESVMNHGDRPLALCLSNAFLRRPWQEFSTLEAQFLLKTRLGYASLLSTMDRHIKETLDTEKQDLTQKNVFLHYLEFVYISPIVEVPALLMGQTFTTKQFSWMVEQWRQLDKASRIERGPAFCEIVDAFKQPTVNMIPYANDIMEAAVMPAIPIAFRQLLKMGHLGMRDKVPESFSDELFKEKAFNSEKEFLLYAIRTLGEGGVFTPFEIRCLRSIPSFIQKNSYQDFCNTLSEHSYRADRRQSDFEERAQQDYFNRKLMPTFLLALMHGTPSHVREVIRELPPKINPKLQKIADILNSYGPPLVTVSDRERLVSKIFAQKKQAEEAESKAAVVVPKELKMNSKAVSDGRCTDTVSISSKPFNGRKAAAGAGVSSSSAAVVSQPSKSFASEEKSDKFSKDTMHKMITLLTELGTKNIKLLQQFSDPQPGDKVGKSDILALIAVLEKLGFEASFSHASGSHSKLSVSSPEWSQWSEKIDKLDSLKLQSETFYLALSGESYQMYHLRSIQSMLESYGITDKALSLALELKKIR